MKEIAICLGTSSAGKTTFAKTQKEYTYFNSDTYFITGIYSFIEALPLFVKKHDKIIVDGWIPREELTNLIKGLEKKYDLRYYFYIVVRDVRVISKIYSRKGRYISPVAQYSMIYNNLDYVINLHGGKGVILQVLTKRAGYLIHPLRMPKDLLDKILYNKEEDEKHS